MVYEDEVKLVFSANEEMPNCQNCDNFDRCAGYHCGPEYAWIGYQRTEIKEN